LIIWLAIGLVFYFSYGISHSKLRLEGDIQAARH
jgi:hypothetical protein